MNGAEVPLTTEQLLEHARWMNALARSLVRDEASAEDIVQQAWVAMLTRPWSRPGAARGWLARVVRNLAGRAHRQEGRVRRRETLAARPECTSAGADVLVERAELQRLVVDVVLDLDEPYRSTVLLRYFEELSPSEIAERQGIPAATVRTRLMRALAQLRVRLDERCSGGRPAWQGALLPLAALDPSISAAELAGSPSAAAAGAQGAALQGGGAAGAASVAPATLATIGGIAMTQKAILGVGAACLITLAAGFGLGRLDRPEELDTLLARGEVVQPERVERLEAAIADLNDQLAEARRDKEASLEDKVALEAKVAELEQSLADARAEDEAAAVATAASALPLDFGKFTELDGIAAADWATMADAAAAMNELWLELMASEKAGEGMPEDFQRRMREENAKLAQVAVALLGKIPTNGPINGEFTHPLVLSNLLASMLDRAGIPLSAEQRADVAALGEQYEAEYEAMQSRYGENTTALQKLVDELDLKADFMSAMKVGLTDEQRAQVIHPELENRMQLDVLSPMTMAITLAKERGGASSEALVERFAGQMERSLGLSPQHLAALEPAFAVYRQDIDALLADGPREGPVGLDEAVAAARAQVKMIEALLALEGLDANTRQKLLLDPSWGVPRLEKK